MKNKDVFTVMGSSNHSDEIREEFDFYATDPIAVELLIKHHTFNGSVWECACGKNHIANVLKEKGFDVRCSDLIDRGVGAEIFDFLQAKECKQQNIITNPPNSKTLEFMEKALDILPSKGQLALFLPIRYLASKKRRKLYDKHPPKKYMFYHQE